jgi:lipopolysaccharide export LptBFGC system permease protein LptF
MGRTLFWYVFKDLLRVFAMASGALAGIMSFGGLLRPLTQQGLDATQVGKMLAYFSPAMLAYSLPIAALFAATVVYGRLSADNELTACRAGGVSLGPLLGMAFPAVIFGILVAGISLAFLCFIVPIYTLKVEKVVYSNLAKLIANRIERTHEIRFGSANIYADSAELPPPDPNRPNLQQVILRNVSIVQYERSSDKPATQPTPSNAKGGRGPSGGADRDALLSADAPDTTRGKFSKVPKEFLMASSALLNITERPDDQVSLHIGLEGGIKFPREFRGGMQAGIRTTQFGPIEMPSPIKEDTKFMDIRKLRELYEKPEKSRRLNGVLADFVRRDQTQAYIRRVAEQLNGINQDDARLNGQRALVLDSPDGKSQIVVSLNTGAPPAQIVGEADEVLVAAPVTTATLPGVRQNEYMIDFVRIDPPPGSAGKGPSIASRQQAKELRVRVRPDAVRNLMSVTVELIGRAPTQLTPSSPVATASTRPIGANYPSTIEVSMPRDIRHLGTRKVDDYLSKGTLPKGDRDRLRREWVILNNNILAEANGRASFAASCLILVLVGSSLGMMFRSGNFLTAFAISFVPALICITLIVAGQQMCHAVPLQLEGKTNPLRLGVVFIWSGNVINFVIATGLLWKLQRQ